MKKIALTKIKTLELFNSEIPKITNDNDVLIKIDSVGVCGSDMHYYNEGKIGDQVIDFPFSIGHECSGTVAETGKNVTRVKPGDLVAVEPALSCHKCSQCLNGREHTCLNQKFLGCPGQAEGCLSDYIIMPEHNCYPVPSNINGEIAALIEPLSIGYYAAQFIDKKNFPSTAVLGSGPIGLSVLLSLQAFGYKDVFATDKLDYRLAAAKKAGAVFTANPDKDDVISLFREENKELFDAVFECCGKQEAIDQAVEILKPGGTLLIVGIPETDRISFDISKIRRKEIAVQNVRRQNNSVQPCIDLTASGKWSPEFMITHRFPADKTNEAFKTVDGYEDGVIKAMIKFGL